MILSKEVGRNERCLVGSWLSKLSLPTVKRSCDNLQTSNLTYIRIITNLPRPVSLYHPVDGSVIFRRKHQSLSGSLAVWLEKYDHLYAGRGNLHTEDHSQNPPLSAHPVVSSWHLLRHESNWVWWHGYFLEYRWCTIHAITYYKNSNAKRGGWLGMYIFSIGIGPVEITE